MEQSEQKKYYEYVGRLYVELARCNDMIQQLQQMVQAKDMQINELTTKIQGPHELSPQNQGVGQANEGGVSPDYKIQAGQSVS